MYRCPECKERAEIIVKNTGVTYLYPPTDPEDLDWPEENRDTDYDGNSEAECASCGCMAILANFLIEDQEAEEEAA